MADEHFDILVVGAGISGIDAGYHIQTDCPGKRYAILEGRAEIGGTWSLFRYPGIRSDSDMFTLGFPFRPWVGSKAMADGPSILQYVRDTAAHFGIDRHIRFQHRVRAATWSTRKAAWRVEVEVGPEREPRVYTATFLYLCSGYYDYDKGHTPDFPGIESFAGRVVHPQKWPDDLDYAGKKVVVIGSGATAVTLVPAMAERAAHVTMLQRSPSYVASLPAEDAIANRLRRTLPAPAAHRLVRAKNVLFAIAFYELCRRAPSLGKKLIRAGVRASLPKGFDVDKHFKPSYDPWDQRLCLVPDGDLFKAISSGRASVVTDHIQTFTKDGIRLESGEELVADIIVTATGLTLLPCGGIRLQVDEAPVELGKSYTYKGMMLSGIPNFAFCMGYTNASWTLRADLSSTYVARLFNYMVENGYKTVTPRASDDLTPEPLLDLTSGYVQRAAHQFPQRGSKAPWYFRQNYILDALDVRLSKVENPNLAFS